MSFIVSTSSLGRASRVNASRAAAAATAPPPLRGRLSSRGSSSTQLAPRFEGRGGGGGFCCCGGGGLDGGATVSGVRASKPSTLMRFASFHACALAANMSRRRTQPPTGVPALSSGLAEVVDRPVHEEVLPRLGSVPTTCPLSSHTICLFLSMTA